MTSDSPFFDSIRVKPDKDRRLRAQCPACEWPNCKAPGTHRAPKGRMREKEYWQFFLGHVREYNHTYNFFAGMNPDDIARYQREAIVGHRPTWKMGMNGGRPTTRSHSSRFRPEFGGAQDPFGVFDELGVRRDPGRGSRSTVQRFLLVDDRRPDEGAHPGRTDLFHRRCRPDLDGRCDKSRGVDLYGIGHAEYPESKL